MLMFGSISHWGIDGELVLLDEFIFVFEVELVFVGSEIIYSFLVLQTFLLKPDNIWHFIFASLFVCPVFFATSPLSGFRTRLD